MTALGQQGYQRVWWVGGAQVINTFRAEGLISEYRLIVIPTLIGQGIALFSPVAMAQPLSLVAVETYGDGVVQLRYGCSKDCTRLGGQ